MTHDELRRRAVGDHAGNREWLRGPSVIAPYGNGTSLQIRVANPRSNALVDLEATLVFDLGKLNAVEEADPAAGRG